MRAVFQRVSRAAAEAGGRTAGAIGEGALLFLGVERDDTMKEVEKLARKVSELRVFPDENDKMNRSVKEIGGGVLLVSNFTLCGDCRRGRRPEFLGAARPEQARPLYEAFAGALESNGVARVETGVFGADMRVTAENDGPVTIILDTKEWD